MLSKSGWIVNQQTFGRGCATGSPGMKIFISSSLTLDDLC
jgi:hypothetical protein